MVAQLQEQRRREKEREVNGSDSSSSSVYSHEDRVDGDEGVESRNGVNSSIQGGTGEGGRSEIENGVRDIENGGVGGGGGGWERERDETVKREVGVF